MIKIAHPVHAIMAVKTIRPKTILMLADELWLLWIFCMAIRTNLLVKLQASLHKLTTINLVTILAGHWAAIVIAGMKRQTETGRGGVLKRFPIPLCW